ncbi:hypothetical protein [Rickettsia endosymbiont of Orchestes rusci]
MFYSSIKASICHSRAGGNPCFFVFVMLNKFAASLLVDPEINSG